MECLVRSGADLTAQGGPEGLDLSGSTLVLSDNFDTSPDWSNPSGEARCVRGARAECADMPPNWNRFRSAERWHPSAGDGATRPSLQISDEQFRGADGKSLVIWDESWGSPGQWGSDAILARELGTKMKDLYAELHVRFEPGFRWHHFEQGGGTNLAKLFRLTHFDSGSGDPFRFFSEGDSAPIYLLDLEVWSFLRDGRVQNRSGIKSAIRCDPQQNNYRCGGFEEGFSDALGGLSFEETFGDGDWHKIGVRVAMNSAPGARDGVVELWVDDVKLARHEGIPFIGASAPADSGWNMVMLGGNMHTYPEPESSRLEQWYAIDDFRLYRLDRA